MEPLTLSCSCEVTILREKVPLPDLEHTGVRLMRDTARVFTEANRLDGEKGERNCHTPWYFNYPDEVREQAYTNNRLSKRLCRVVATYASLKDLYEDEYTPLYVARCSCSDILRKVLRRNGVHIPLAFRGTFESNSLECVAECWNYASEERGTDAMSITKELFGCNNRKWSSFPGIPLFSAFAMVPEITATESTCLQWIANRAGVSILCSTLEAVFPYSGPGDHMCNFVASLDNLSLLKWFVSIGYSPSGKTFEMAIARSTSHAYLYGLDVPLPANLNRSVLASKCFKVWKWCTGKSSRFDAIYLMEESRRNDDILAFSFASRLNNRRILYLL